MKLKKFKKIVKYDWSEYYLGIVYPFTLTILILFTIVSFLCGDYKMSSIATMIIYLFSILHFLLNLLLIIRKVYYVEDKK